MHEGPTENRLGELGSLCKYYYYYYYYYLRYMQVQVLFSGLCKRFSVASEQQGMAQW